MQLKQYYLIYMRYHHGSKSNTNWSRWLACREEMGELYRVGNLRGAELYTRTLAEYTVRCADPHPKRGLWREFEIRPLKGKYDE
jgi:hypothetical protein